MLLSRDQGPDLQRSSPSKDPFPAAEVDAVRSDVAQPLAVARWSDPPDRAVEGVAVSALPRAVLTLRSNSAGSTEAQPGKHDDRVIAAAIGWEVRQRPKPVFRIARMDLLPYSPSPHSA